MSPNYSFFEFNADICLRTSLTRLFIFFSFSHSTIWLTKLMLTKKMVAHFACAYHTCNGLPGHTRAQACMCVFCVSRYTAKFAYPRARNKIQAVWKKRKNAKKKTTANMHMDATREYKQHHGKWKWDIWNLKLFCIKFVINETMSNQITGKIVKSKNL